MKQIAFDDLNSVNLSAESALYYGLIADPCVHINATSTRTHILGSSNSLRRGSEI